MKAASDRITCEIEAFIAVVLNQASNFVQVSDLQEEILSLIEYTTDRIDEFLAENSNNPKLQMEVMLDVTSRLERYFQYKNVVDDACRENLRIFYRDQAKYLHRSYETETNALSQIFHDEMNETSIANQSLVQDDFAHQGYKFRRLKLPYINADEAEIELIYQAIKNSNLFDQFMDFASRTDWESAPHNIRNYLQKVLEYDIGCSKCTLLWDVLGYSLIRLEEIKQGNILFKDLFRFPEDFNKARQVFQQNGIIKINPLSMGVIVNGSINKHTVASLIAIAEVLTEYGFLKNTYTLTEQVRIMAAQFNMEASYASLTKKSKYHEQMKDKLREILSRQ